MTSLNTVYWFKAFLEQRGHKKEEKALSYSITSNFQDSEKKGVLNSTQHGFQTKREHIF